MVLTASTMLELGTTAPDFCLPATDGQQVQRSDFSGKPLLVMFLCNHCPYVKHICTDIAQSGNRFQQQGVGVVAISANDVETHPDDGPDKMAEEAAAVGYLFPYLYDESQDAAKGYRAACTPDFFLFDEQHRLVYRGRYDDSLPENDNPVSGSDLNAAVEAVLAGESLDGEQHPSVGCNIKWKSGNEPSYFSG